MLEFLNLKKVNEPYTDEIKRALARVLDAGHYIMGDELNLFETNLSAYTGAKYALGVSNGLMALTLILRGYRELSVLKSGDEVLVPANTYFATILAITENELKPVLVEPDLFTFNIDYRKLEEKISNKTRALMLVHLYGQVAMTEPIKMILKKYNLLCIEDNAQAFGAQWQGKRSGNLGDAAAYSFYPTKNLGALADAGAVTTNDTELSEAILALRNYGSKRKNEFRYNGFNARLSEMQAAILNVKIHAVDSENQKRRELAAGYSTKLQNEHIQRPKSPFDPNAHVWHLYVVRCEEREKFRKYLYEHEVETAIHYPVPPHKQPACHHLSHLNLPITEQIHREVVSLPLNTTMTVEDVEFITQVINDYKA